MWYYVFFSGLIINISLKEVFYLFAFCVASCLDAHFYH